VGRTPSGVDEDEALRPGLGSLRKLGLEHLAEKGREVNRPLAGRRLWFTEALKGASDSMIWRRTVIDLLAHLKNLSDEELRDLATTPESAYFMQKVYRIRPGEPLTLDRIEMDAPGSTEFL
jgi:hypothetical protein